MQGRNGLVLLDNAVDEQQVRDLIPASSTCLVLITSRRCLAGLDGAVLQEVEVFTSEESVALLSRIVGADRVEAEPAMAEHIVRACGYLPLAISIAASRLRSRPAWRLADLAHRLNQGLAEVVSGSRALRPVFDMSYQALPASSRLVFRLLGKHPGADFTAPAVAALADIPVDEAAVALEQLLDEHLLRQVIPDRYEFHDLLRLLAIELARTEPDVAEPDSVEPDVVEPGLAAADPSGPCGVAPLARLTQWFLSAAYGAAIAIDTPELPELPDVGSWPAFEDYGEGMAWFEQERGNLAAIQQAALSAGLHRLVWQLAVVQKEYLTTTDHLYYRDMLVAMHFALTAARALPDPWAEAFALAGIAFVHQRLHHLDDAEDAYREAHQAWHALADLPGQGAALLGLGVVSSLRGDHDTAAEHLTAALPLLADERSVRKRAVCLMNLGLVRQRQAMMPDAITLTLLATSLLTGCDDRRNLAIALGNLAEFHHATHKFDHALEYCAQMEELGQALCDPHLRARAQLILGDIHLAQDHPAQARQAWQDAHALWESIQHPRIAEASERLRSNPLAPDCR